MVYKEKCCFGPASCYELLLPLKDDYLTLENYKIKLLRYLREHFPEGSYPCKAHLQTFSGGPCPKYVILVATDTDPATLALIATTLLV